MDDQGPGTGYAQAEAARAFRTALDHPDRATRDRAERRLDRWGAVLRGMASGGLRIGTRTPVAGLPAWVTPEVLHGGFATGRAAAEVPLRDHELALAASAGIPARRSALFAHHLGEAGLARLWTMLDDGRYRVRVPEHGALLAVAHLVRTGHVRDALDLVATLEPLADRLVFAPEPADVPLPETPLATRRTVAEVRDRLRSRAPDPRVEAQREAHAVWNPLADEFLQLWLDEPPTGPDDAWTARAARLVGRYHALASRHTRCRKHRDPKQNLAVLRSAAEAFVAGGEPTPRQRGRVRVAVAGMLSRRGAPGSERHTAVRARQAADAAAPSHSAVAAVVARRLEGLPADEGVPDAEALLVPVEPDAPEGVPDGVAVPSALRRTVVAAQSGTVRELVARGLVPSAEELAALVPRELGTALAASYPPPVNRLVAAVETAFRARRSVLLLDHSHQVGAAELPWLAALGRFRGGGGTTGEHLDVVAHDVADLVLTAFPGTPMPNALVSELRALTRADGSGYPWVAELAADIFTGTFTPTFLDAAERADALLAGTPYARYYGLDTAALQAARAAGVVPVGGPRDAPPHIAPAPRPLSAEGFAQLCRERAGLDAGRGRTALPGGPLRHGVAASGSVIEQAQILTTHNLALVVTELGVRPAPGWEALARRAFADSAERLGRADHHPRPESVARSAAGSWRQSLFFLSMADPAAQERFVGWAAAQRPGLPVWVLDGLADALGGAVLAPHRRFLGWTFGPHPVLTGGPPTP